MEWTLALKLLAVYFGTAAASLWLAHRFVSPIRFRVAVFLALAPFLLVGKAMVTGGVYAPLDITYNADPFRAIAAEHGTAVVHTPILSDVVSSMIPWRKAVREAVKNGRPPLWNRFCLAGEPLLAVQQHGALHPETWLAFLLPLASGWTLMMALRFLVSLACAYLFVKDLTDAQLPALFAAVSWAFCDFLVFFTGYPLSVAIGPMPLLLLGLRRLARDPGRVAVAVTVVALFLIIAAGHPESLLHCVAAGGVYFLFELFWARREVRPRALSLAVLAGALALGLCAVLLLPLLEILPVTFEHAFRSATYAYQKKSLPLAASLQHAAADVVPYAFGISGKSETRPGFHEPGAYAGSILWPLALVGAFSRRREKWAFLTLGFLGLTVSIGLVGVADTVSRLPLFRIALNERLAFLGALSLALLAALGLERITRRETGRELAIAALLCAIALGILFLRLRPTTLALGLPVAELNRRFLFQLVPLLLLGILAEAVRRWGAVTAAAVLVLLLVARRLESGGVYPTYRADAFAPDLPVLDPIPRGAPYRFAAVGYSFIPNVAALYELEDVRSYSSMTLLRLAETFPLWCIPQPIWYNRVDDPTRPFLSFLNVRYVLLSRQAQPPEGWSILATSLGGTLVENPRVLPRVFVPRFVAYIRDPSRQIELLGKIEDFGGYGIIERGGEPRVDSDSWTPNGEASVRILEYTAQKLRLQVDSQSSALVATSIPAWPGWRVTVNGREITTSTYNRAFIVFRVPAGHQDVKLRYWPRGFVHGLFLSGITLLTTLLLGLLAKTRVVPVQTGETSP